MLEVLGWGRGGHWKSLVVDEGVDCSKVFVTRFGGGFVARRASAARVGLFRPFSLRKSGCFVTKGLKIDGRL